MRRLALRRWRRRIEDKRWLRGNMQAARGYHLRGLKQRGLHYLHHCRMHYTRHRILLQQRKDMRKHEALWHWHFCAVARTQRRGTMRACAHHHTKNLIHIFFIYWGRRAAALLRTYSKQGTKGIRQIHMTLKNQKEHEVTMSEPQSYITLKPSPSPSP